MRGWNLSVVPASFVLYNAQNRFDIKSNISNAYTILSNLFHFSIICYYRIIQIDYNNREKYFLDWEILLWVIEFVFRMEK